MVQRVISGVVLRETDPIQTPLRKMSGSGFASIMIAVVALAGAALIGIFFPSGNKTWQEGNRVIVEEESGATFVWLPDAQNERLLHPTANFTSAALLVGSREFVNVSHVSLLGVPRGPRLGIPDAPDSLPEPELMLEGGWTLCSLPAREVDGALVPNTALVVGRDPSEGERIADEAALVRDVTRNTLHLVWHGYQFPIIDENPVREALFLQTAQEIEVGTAWLNALPPGRPLQPNPVAGRGDPSTAITNGTVGEIRVVEADGRREYYQVGLTQIIEITQVQAQILLADPEISQAYGDRPVTELPLTFDEAADADRVDLGDPAPTDPPATVPDKAVPTTANPTICASFGDDQATPEISIDAKVEGAAGANATQQQTESGTVLADSVVVEPGHGAIVQEQASPGAENGVRYLVTDEGRRFALTSAEVQATLGYGSIEPVRLPASLVARIPAGSELNPLEARRPAV